ncbi:MAG: diguanylate cyclase [Zavarzinia sp.]|nr:diguanylate cyclase [Zavarzinia sp.]
MRSAVAAQFEAQPPQAQSILIVDDDPAIVQLLGEMLKPFGEIRFALSGEQALAITTSFTPDLILLDINMPGVNGLDVCRRLKANPGLREVPIIFVTGQNDLTSEVAALEAGAVDFIAKPLATPIVVARVRTHLRLHQLTEALKHSARTDALTGLPNRRAFDEELAAEWRRASRRREPLSLLLFDIDHFKAFNDSHGHPAGDECLRIVGQAIAAFLKRPGDLAARYGGEEFAVILPATDCPDALRMANALVRTIADTAITLPNALEKRRVTISVGAATVELPAPGTAIAALVECADSALYRAKRNGRNRAEFQPFGRTVRNIDHDDPATDPRGNPIER